MKTCLEIRVAIYGDFQNVRISPKQIPSFYRWLNQKGKLLIFKGYAYWRKEAESFEQSIFNAGIDPLNVPSLEENAVDNLLIKHCKQDTSSNPKIKLVILITGDGDFIPLVKYLQELGIKVMLIYRCANASQKLIEAVDEAYDIDKLLDYIKDETITEEKPNFLIMISYEKAKQCLIESIQKVHTEGKKATFSLIGKLIKDRLRFSGYKNVSSIAKQTGGKFSKFSQFVESVIQEGIIKNSNGNLILVQPYNSHGINSYRCSEE